VGDKGTLLRSTDGGLTWEVTHLLAGISGDFVDIQFHSEQKGWLLANTYRTDDRGNVVEASSSILLATDGGTVLWWD